MPPRNGRLRIEDMIEAIAQIKEYTRDIDFEAFAKDRRTIDAVVRNITIIGEASRHVPIEIRSAHPEVPWAQMLGMRNIV